MNETETIGVVKDWHDPRNEDCEHNQSVDRDCKCKRPMKRKPYRVIRVCDNGVEHNINPRLIFEIYRDGTVVIREHKRRKRYHTTAAKIYRYLRWQASGIKLPKGRRRK